MTDCPNGDIRDLLPDLLHGRLDESERARVEQHVASCDACSAELALLRDLRSTIRRAPAVDVAVIAASIPAYRAPMRQRTWAGWRAAAAIAAIAIGGTSVAIVGREWRPVSSSGTTSTTLPTDSMLAVQVAPPVSPESAPRSSAQLPQVPRSSTPSTASTPAVTEPVSLAMAGGAIGELSDHELSTLVDEIESLDALPSEEIESTGTLSGTVPLEQTR